MGAREDYVAGLRGLANMLENVPELPLPDELLDVCVIEQDDEIGRARIEEIADLLDAEVHESAGGVLSTSTVKFGPIAYRAFYCSVATMQRHRALQSYADNVAVA